MSSSTGRSATWWKLALESGADVPEPEEPWAELEPAIDDERDLSDDQRALLAGLADQPEIPRLRSLPDDGA